ncbi:MAG: hypothetical protein M0Q38_10065 [Bacteroidales bacterium]|nr:hypothetical protein [Bacteroidales bacterium]
MKKIILLFSVLFILVSSNLSYCDNSTNEITVSSGDLSTEGTITILSAPDLQNLTHMWVSEYNGINPDLKAKVSQITGNSITDNIAGVNLKFVSDEYFTKLNNKSSWNMVVGRDAIVPIINLKNPFLNEINIRGLSADEFALLFNNSDLRNWGLILSNGQNIPVKIYMLNDASVQAHVAAFLNVNQLSMTGIIVESEQTIKEAVQKDPYAIGFCRVINILDPITKNFVTDIRILPVDKNRNGRIDYFEKIFNSPDNFLRGVWIGKYPQALCRNIYAVSKGKPENTSEIAFLKWILTDGQQFLVSNGYSGLVSSEQLSNLAGLQSNEIYIASSGGSSIIRIVIILLIVLVMAGLTLSIVFHYRKHKNEIIQNITYKSHPVFDENSIIAPGGIYFDKSHTWAFMEQNGIVKIGIDDFLQHITGPLTRITMKNPGEKIIKGEKILTIIQNGKQLNIYAPISGLIHSQNKFLINHLSVINSSPYTDGWVYMIEPANWLRETQFLIMAEKYIPWLKNEFSRLKDFFAVSASANRMEYAHVVLQDGGVLKDNVLMNLGPKVWEDFQTNFMDTFK